jgi:chitodextrinase
MMAKNIHSISNKEYIMTNQKAGRWQFKATILTLSISLIAACCFGIFGGKVAAAACSAPATTYGTDTMTVSAPSTGTYYAWVRMENPSTSANSIMMQIDGDSCFTVGGSSSAAANTWNWIDYDSGSTSDVMSTSLTQGTHSIELIGTEAGVSVDRIEFLSAPPSSCTPTSTGENCAPSNPAPPTVSFTAPSQGSTVSGSSGTITALAASASGVSQIGIRDVVIKLDSTILATLTSSPYTTPWDTTTASNGTHTLTAIATDTQGNQTTATETVTVSNNKACAAAPTAPTAITATAKTDTSITLGWTAPTPPANCTITKYNVYQVGGNTDVLLGTSTTDSYAIQGMSPNTNYTFVVSAADSVGTSANSAPYTVTTSPESSDPTAPTNVTVAAASPTSVNLSWTAATDEVGVSYYRIYRNGTLLPTVATGTSFTDATASPGTNYTYQVSAVNSATLEGPKASTTPTTITTPAAVVAKPTTPTNLAASLITSNSAVLAWTGSSESGGSVAGYFIYRYVTTAGASTASEVGGVVNPTYTDPVLTASTSYSYYVVAVDPSGNRSADSSTITVTTLAGTSTTCSPDLNGDGTVDIYDASIMFSHWDVTPATCAEGDLNVDKIVNIYDASILFSHWGDKE